MGIGSFLKREAKNFSSGIGAQDGLQDWAHAARVFTDEDMLRSPKFKGMFHVTFVFNESILNNVSQAKGFAEALGKKSDVLSVLTKSVSLPKFTLENTTHNQYNKNTTTYKKLKYDPVDIAFHDDMSDVVWGFWAFYYAWYFAEGSKGYSGGTAADKGNKLRGAYEKLVTRVVSNVLKVFTKSSVNDGLSPVETTARGTGVAGGPSEWDIANKFPLLLGNSGDTDFDVLVGLKKSGADYQWSDNWSDAWGLNGSPFYSLSTDASLHLLKAIEIYPLGNKQASTIVLHNPKITSWDHDSFEYGANGTAVCKMQLVYDGVSYLDQRSAAGVLEDVNLYDRHPSPLMRGTPRAVLGPGGILDQAEGVIGNIMNGEFGLGDLITTVGIARSLSKKGFASSTKAELKETVTQAVTGAVVNKVFPGSR